MVPLVDPAAQKALWPKSPIELASDMKAPVLGLYGGDDQGIPPAQVDMMKAALAAAGKPPNSKSIRARRMVSMLITVRVTMRQPPRMPGYRLKIGSSDGRFCPEPFHLNIGGALPELRSQVPVF